MIKPGPGMYKYLRNAIREIDEDYDYIIFDTQPHAGLLLGNVLMACQFIVTPCTCDAFGIQGMMDFYDTIKEYQEDNEKLQILGLLIIKYKGRQSLTKDIDDNLLPQYAERMHTKIFESRIRESVKCQEAQTLRMSIFDYAPNSTTAIDYNNFVDELIREVS
jgi:chromosome partitioning protein